MEKEDFFYYVELALTNLDATNTMRHNIEGELCRLLEKYTVQEVKELVKDVTFKK